MRRTSRRRSRLSSPLHSRRRASSAALPTPTRQPRRRSAPASTGLRRVGSTSSSTGLPRRYALASIPNSPRGRSSRLSRTRSATAGRGPGSRWRGTGRGSSFSSRTTALGFPRTSASGSSRRATAEAPDRTAAVMARGSGWRWRAGWPARRPGTSRRCRATTAGASPSACRPPSRGAPAPRRGSRGLRQAPRG